MLEKDLVYETLNELRRVGKEKSDYERVLLIGAGNMMEEMARKIFDTDIPHNQQINADRAGSCPHCGGTGGAHQGDCKIFENL